MAKWKMQISPHTYGAKASILNTCLVIILIVAPAIAVARQQNHEQQGTAQSQAGTKSMVASDPCASFPPLTPQAKGAGPEKTDKGDAASSVQAGVTVRISPHTDTRLATGYALLHTATVSGSTNSAVDWTVDGPGCSSHDCGTIIENVYFAPVTAPNPPIVRLTATSKADSRASDSIEVCVMQHGSQWNLSSASGELRTATRLAALAASGRDVEILTDTLGVDFGPYLKRVIHDIKRNWYASMPEEAKDPLLMRGTVALEFVVLKNGHVTELHYANPSGDLALDGACYAAVSTSEPFPPLPSEFSGQFLRVRMTFHYNPSSTATPIKTTTTTPVH